jgi:hypothetical protein
MTLWQIFWAVVLGAGLVGEAIALWDTHQGDTLSEQVWHLFACCPFLRFVGTSLLLWAALHFATLGVYAGWKTFGGWCLATVGLYFLLEALRS